MIKLLIPLAAVVLLSGCTTKMCKSGGTQDSFNRDMYECEYRGRQMSQLGDVYDPFTDFSEQRRCMEYKGWRKCND